MPTDTANATAMLHGCTTVVIACPAMSRPLMPIATLMPMAMPSLVRQPPPEPNASAELVVAGVPARRTGQRSGILSTVQAPSVEPDLVVDGAPARSLGRRRVLIAFALLGGGAMGGLAMVCGFLALFISLSWPHVEAAGNPAFGINYSCNQAEYLLLEDPALGPAGYVSDNRPGRAEWCAETLGTLLRGTGARYLRLSVEWSQIEPAPGAYDFRLVDALLQEAERNGVRVLFGVGVKGQRHPEFYIPGWVTRGSNLRNRERISDDPFLHDRALEMVRAVVAHVAASPAIDAWSADNEPYVASLRSEEWTLSREFVAEEVRAIRESDPAHRLVSINHGQHFVFDRRWQDALADGDVLAASLYPFRNYEVLGHQFVMPILEIGPLAPNYAYQARSAHDAGKEYWLTEMQAEPWVDGDIRLVSPNNPSPNLTAANFRKNVEYARRSGADRVYLWGAEWWLYEKLRFGDSTWWDLGRDAIARSPGAPSLP